MESLSGELLGEPIYLPSRRAVLQHILFHALEHFISSSGRALMWLEIATIHPMTDELLALQHQGLIYPIVRLARRVL